MAMGAAILGGAILGGAMPTQQIAPASLSYSLFQGYRLDLMDPDGDRIATIKAYEPKLDEGVNDPGSLTFSVPVDDWYSDDLKPPNYVALYDRANTLVQVFEIVEEDEAYSDKRTKTITCAGPMYLLNDDSINYQNYADELDTPDTAVTTITAILAAQTNTRKVTLGGIEAALSGLTFAIKSEWETPLAALQRLRDVIGGFFWVDADLKLWWRQSYTTNETRELRWKKNLLGFQPSIDNDGVITHLRYLGRESGGTQVALPGVGYLVSDYWTEGDRKRWHTEVDQEIYFQETLEKAAALFLSEHERPRVRATVSILDLSESPAYDYDDWYTVTLGDLVNVYHPSLGDEPMALTVVGRSVALDKPMAVSLELGEMPPDVARIIAEIRTRQRRRDRDGGGNDSEVFGFETDPGVFQPPGNADTPSVGDSPNAIRSDAILPILPGSGYTPEPILPTTGTAGVGPYAAPQDHQHPLDPLDLLDDFGTAGFVTQDNFPDALIDTTTTPSAEVKTALSGALATDDEPQPIVSHDPVAGASEEFARADHKHLGQPFISVAAYGDLPTTGQEDGVIGYTNGDDAEASWMKIGGAWKQHVIYLGTFSTLPAIPTAYCAKLKFALQTWEATPGDTVWTPCQRQTTYSGAPGTNYP